MIPLWSFHVNHLSQNVGVQGQIGNITGGRMKVSKIR
jgi:hypothetical protein